jgi:hypothetical protein
MLKSFVKKHYLLRHKRRREYLNLGCVRAIYDSDKNSRFSMRYSAKWSNKGLHSLLHGIGWTLDSSNNPWKKRSFQPSMFTISTACSLSAYLACYQPTLFPFIKPCSLSAQHVHLPCSLLVYLAYYQHIMLAVLLVATSWYTLLAISISYSVVPTLLLACYQHM